MRDSRARRTGRLTTVLTALALCAAAGCTVPPAATEATDAAPVAAPSVLVGEPVSTGRTLAPSPQDDVLTDQGIPVTLPDGRTLWIFADTADLFTGPYMFQTSSAAISEQAHPNVLRYFNGWDDKPAEFLPRKDSEQPRNETTYDGVWPMGATTLPDGRILISYSTYHVNLFPIEYTFRGSGLFEYRYPGYENVQYPLVATRLADDIWGPDDGPVNSPVYADGQVYFLNCGLGGCFSVRATPENLADKAAYQWWTGSGWSADRAARVAVSFGDSHQPGRSASVSWVPQLGAYALLDTDLGAPDTTGYLWLAARPQGPWSAAAPFTMANCGTRSCYLPVAHPQSSTASSLRVVYSSGSTWGPTLWTMDLPVMAKVPQRFHIYDGPVAVADSRTGWGVPAPGPLAPGAWRHVWVGQADQPTNLATVTVAVTVSALAPGRLQVGPSGSFRPGRALDYPAGDTRVEVEVPVGPNGRVAVANEGFDAHVKVDLLAWTSVA
jgi:hypothetical protein